MTKEKEHNQEEVLPPEVVKAVDWLEEQIRKLMEGEYHKEAFFRALITQTELGDAMKYITHDRELNPLARPHGTPNEELLAYGQLLVQIFGLMMARGISFKEALSLGLKNWQDRDWQKKEGTSFGSIEGLAASLGIARGRAFVVSSEHPLEEFLNGIVVAPFITVDDVMFFHRRRPLAIVTDHGGTTSHPAILARDFRIPAVVGCGNATERISHGVEILVEAENEKGLVTVL